MIHYALDPHSDGTFSNDLTGLVLAAEWSIGMARAYDSLAAPLQGTLILRDPAFTAAPGLPVRITTAGHTLLTALVDFVAPLPETGEARLHLRGPESPLLLPSPPVRRQQQTATADTLIAAILAAVAPRRPVLAGYMVLGTPGYDRLGSAKLCDLAWPQNLEPGRSALMPAADLSDRRAYDRIGRIAASERGRFYFDRAGTAVFRNRHYTLTHLQSAATFNDTAAGVALTYGADVLHSAAISIQPRSVGAPGTVLWSLAEPLLLAGGVVRQISAPYRDEQAQPVAAFDLVPPQPGKDFSAVDATTGADMTRYLRCTLLAAGEHAALLEIRAATARPLRVLSLRLRGTPLHMADPVTLEHTRPYSRTFYAGDRLHLHLPALVDLEDADRIARYELARRQDPRPVATSITLSAPADLSLKLFDRITVTASRSNHSGDYFIIGEQHRVTRDTGAHTVTYRLEPADSDRFLIIGSGKPDGTRYLAY